MKCSFRAALAAVAMLLSTTFVFADDAKKETKPAEGAKKPAEAAAGDRKPTEGKTSEAKPNGETKRKPEAGAERKPAAGTERKPEAAGERKPGRDGGGQRSEFPAEIKLTEEQNKKLADLRVEAGTKFSELSKQRDAILSAEQLAARKEVEQKARDGSLSRQEYADAIAAALKLTDDQKKKMEAVEVEANKMRQEIDTARMAILTDEQKSTFRKLMAAREIERMFSLPAEFTVTDEQKTGLKALEVAHAAELKSLTEKRDVIMTDERKAALAAVYKDARDNNKDRQAMSEAIDAALKLTDAEKTELNETQQKLGELNRTIHERKLALLTAEQKQEFEKKFGSRGR